MLRSSRRGDPSPRASECRSCPQGGCRPPVQARRRPSYVEAHGRGQAARNRGRACRAPPRTVAGLAVHPGEPRSARFTGPRQSQLSMGHLRSRLFLAPTPRVFTDDNSEAKSRVLGGQVPIQRCTRSASAERPQTAGLRRTRAVGVRRREACRDGNDEDRGGASCHESVVARRHARIAIRGLVRWTYSRRAERKRGSLRRVLASSRDRKPAAAL